MYGDDIDEAQLEKATTLVTKWEKRILRVMKLDEDEYEDEKDILFKKADEAWHAVQHVPDRYFPTGLLDHFISYLDNSERDGRPITHEYFLSIMQKLKEYVVILEDKFKGKGSAEVDCDTQQVDTDQQTIPPNGEEDEDDEQGDEEDPPVEGDGEDDGEEDAEEDRLEEAQEKAQEDAAEDARIAAEAEEERQRKHIERRKEKAQEVIEARIRAVEHAKAADLALKQALAAEEEAQRSASPAPEASIAGQSKDVFKSMDKGRPSGTKKKLDVVMEPRRPGKKIPKSQEVIVDSDIEVLPPPKGGKNRKTSAPAPGRKPRAAAQKKAAKVKAEEEDEDEDDGIHLTVAQELIVEELMKKGQPRRAVLNETACLRCASRGLKCYFMSAEARREHESREKKHSCSLCNKAKVRCIIPGAWPAPLTFATAVPVEYLNLLDGPREEDGSPTVRWEPEAGMPPPATLGDVLLRTLLVVRQQRVQISDLAEKVKGMATLHETLGEAVADRVVRMIDLSFQQAMQEWKEERVQMEKESDAKYWASSVSNGTGGPTADSQLRTPAAQKTVGPTPAPKEPTPAPARPVPSPVPAKRTVAKTAAAPVPAVKTVVPGAIVHPLRAPVAALHTATPPAPVAHSAVPAPVAKSNVPGPVAKSTAPAHSPAAPAQRRKDSTTPGSGVSPGPGASHDKPVAARSRTIQGKAPARPPVQVDAGGSISQAPPDPVASVPANRTRLKQKAKEKEVRDAGASLSPLSSLDGLTDEEEDEQAPKVKGKKRPAAEMEENDEGAKARPPPGLRTRAKKVATGPQKK